MKNWKQRREIARLARAYLAGNVEHDRLAIAAYESEQDDDIDELDDLITHMPPRGGLFGLSEDQHKKYRQSVEAAIQMLEK